MRTVALALLLPLLAPLTLPAAPAQAMPPTTDSAPAARATGLPSKAQWQADVRAAYAKAQPGAYLAERVASGEKRLAIVLDIDNTSLASHYAWPKPVGRTLKLAKRATKLGVAVIFVTGRYDDTLDEVTPALTAAGYDYESACGRKLGEAIVDGKQRCRAAYVDEGWTFILNIGNHGTDFVGGDYERKVRLPGYRGLLG
ncbi:HAD family acid phosphatase [Nocardioides sp.]|uniref:HAD family acid phosphatase n=1 Tax=Nocardioides sp. TaxID=35761 RepID=UPI0039E674E4